MEKLFGLVLFAVLAACGNVDSANNNIVEDDTANLIVISDTLEITEEVNQSLSCEYTFLSELESDYNNSSEVKVIGLFDSTWVAGEESVYGFNVKLWKVDDAVIGFVNQYKGSPEPYLTGPIVSGEINGEAIGFTAYLRLSKGYSSWKESDVILLTFDGNLRNNQLSGTLDNINCTTKTANDNFKKSWNLSLSETWPMENFENIQAWKKANEYQLDMNP